jgi:UDP-N-acetylglucosamine pyrophosphorylase
MQLAVTCSLGTRFLPGVQAAGEAAFVLVAGGLGERLGYSGIKLALMSDTARGACFLQVVILLILAMNHRLSLSFWQQLQCTVA